jgi:hypothetical protein
VNKEDYNNNVFINCPFDDTYTSHFHTIVYAIIRCGFTPRCAFEHDDGSEIRLEKLFRLIKQCKYGVHDISNTTLDIKSCYPRFNMPFELGVFLGAKKYGNAEQKRKNILVFEKQKFSSKIYLSDLNGIDPKSHEINNEIDNYTIIRHIRSWLHTASLRKIPSHAVIQNEFEIFYTKTLPSILKTQKVHIETLTFNDYCLIVEEWLSTKII